MKPNTRTEVDARDLATVFVSGDFCPARIPPTELQGEDAAARVFGDLHKNIRSADLSMTNLECPLTLSVDSVRKVGLNLRAKPEVASFLQSAGFDVANLANNHIYDYGQSGLHDTLQTLRRHGLQHVGAGLTIQDAQATLALRVKDIRIAVVNFADAEFGGADPTHGGAHPLDLIDNAQCIQSAREQNDHVLVIVHAGHEHSHYPSPATQKRYRFYAELGASAVIAHHTHCIGGYETHRAVPIFYSLGNFIFPTRYKVADSWYEGYALSFRLTKDSLAFEILPYEQCKRGTVGISTSRKTEILNTIERLSLALSNHEEIQERWLQFCADSRAHYLEKISGFGRYKNATLKRLGLLDRAYRRSQQHLLRVWQVVQTETHREVVSTVLSSHLRYWEKR